MKKIIISLLAILALSPAFAQEAGKNWTVEMTATDATGNSYYSDLVYYDGLGMPAQAVSVGAATNGRNIVSPVVYDGMKRMGARQLLPYVSTSSSLSMDAGAEEMQRQYYSAKFGSAEAARAFVESKFEASPLGRVTEMYNAGKDFFPNGKKTVLGYGSNSTADNVRRLEPKSIGTSLTIGTYAANTLHKTTATDADGAVSVVFTDKNGRTVLERLLTDGTHSNVDTYYAYYPNGSLAWTVTPQASASLSGSSLAETAALADQFCFIYKYDNYGRLSERKNPGQVKETYQYDAKDRLISGSRGAERMDIAYDALNRPIRKTYVKNGQSVVYAEYIYTSYPVGVRAFLPVAGFDQAADFRTKDMLVSQKILILDGNEFSAPKYVQTNIYYDSYARPIQVVEQNHLNGISRTTVKYSFTGRVEKIQESHQPSASASADVLLTTLAYDTRGRLLSETAQLNGGTPAVVAYGYDDLGQLISKKHGSGTGVATDSYSYNIQGQLTQIDNNRFNMKLRYHDATRAAKSYTGNVAEWEWQHKNVSQPVRMQALAYDKAGRLTASVSYVSGSASGTTQTFSYDRNGNILSMRKPDNALWTYSYTGNRLTQLNAGGVNHAFAYDANGNTTTDGLNALNLEYNFLNLTKQVRQGNTVKANYAWTAEGGKRSAVNGTGNGGYEYLGSLVYQRNGSTLTLESAGFSGGLITPSETQYYLADHLGSTRVVVNGSGTELARYDYDPFGQATTPTGLLSSNRYLFQGKESQNAFGIPYNDHGWRMYDPKRGGWGTQDALYQYASPYTFCGNNPLNFIDPTGLWSEDPDYIWELFPIGDGSSAVCTEKSGRTKADEKRRKAWNLKANYILSAFIEDGGGYEGGGTRKYRINEHGRRIEELSLTEVQNLIRDLNPAIQAVHQGHYGFWNDPVTKAVVGTLLFVATGGIEFTLSIGSGITNLAGRSVITGVTNPSTIQTVSKTTITGFTKHGMNQAITRGFQPSNVLNIVRNGNPVSAMGRFGSQMRYTLNNNTVVLNSAGKIVSVFSNNPGTRLGLGQGFFIPQI